MFNFKSGEGLTLSETLVSFMFRQKTYLIDGIAKYEIKQTNIQEIIVYF